MTVTTVLPPWQWIAIAPAEVEKFKYPAECVAHRCPRHAHKGPLYYSLSTVGTVPAKLYPALKTHIREHHGDLALLAVHGVATEPPQVLAPNVKPGIWFHDLPALATLRGSDGCNWGVGCPPPPVVTRRHNTRHKKTGHRLSHAGYQEASRTTLPERHVCAAGHRQQQTVFFCFWVVHQGFFTVTVQQGSHSLSLSMSVPLSSSLTARALALAKEDRELPESETCPRLSTYSAVSGRTRSQGSYSLSLCSRVLIHCHCHCQYHFPRH